MLSALRGRLMPLSNLHFLEHGVMNAGSQEASQRRPIKWMVNDATLDKGSSNADEKKWISMRDFYWVKPLGLMEWCNDGLSRREMRENAYQGSAYTKGWKPVLCGGYSHFISCFTSLFSRSSLGLSRSIPCCLLFIETNSNKNYWVLTKAESLAWLICLLL